MKRAKPKQHTRRLRTGKKILINKGVKPRIKNSERKIFTHLSDPKNHQIEFGGAIDFNKKGKIENIQVIPGSEFEVDLPSDFEVLYHTHPDKKASPPTPEDILAILSDPNQQAELIFRKGKSFLILKTPLTKDLEKEARKDHKKILSILYSKFEDSMGNKWEENWKKELEKLGFIVQINNNNKSNLSIPIKTMGLDNKRKKIWD